MKNDRFLKNELNWRAFNGILNKANALQIRIGARKCIIAIFGFIL